jgi:hypothetical protein
MCQPGPSPDPANCAEALAAVSAGLRYLATVPAADLTSGEYADCLRGLAAAESVHLAATASMLAAFDASGSCADDGQMTSRAWLRWQTRITNAAAGTTAVWMRRLSAHADVAEALTEAAISPSFAREICDWTDTLPEEHRTGADRILLGAASTGAELADLAGLAEEIHRYCARPDADDGDDRFARRRLRLTRHYRGHARLDADLTPDAAAALQAVLDSLGKKAGPEDDRTQQQRDHDALAEACGLLVAGGLPDRAGQPTQIQLHMTLEQLLGLPGAQDAITAWAGTAAAPAPPGAACDAAIVPIVTGTVDHHIAEQLAAALLRSEFAVDAGSRTASGLADSAPAAAAESADGATPASATTCGMGERAARQLAIRWATSLLSGPTGLAAWLRTSLLKGPAAPVSLPLDVGTATDTVPPHLRRAIIRRDKHCRFPGCQIRTAACHVHHLIPLSEGGPTKLDNCLLACGFHHLIAIHRWGWRLTLDADGSTTAVSPDGTRVLHSHAAAAAA